MSVILERTPVELREAMLELSVGGGEPDPETLDALVRRLPQYARELTDFAIDLVVVGMADEDDSFVVVEDEPLSAEAASALSVFQNALFNARNEAASAQAPTGGVGVPPNPFARLDRGGVKALADGLQASKAFVVKLRDRIIIAETMTEGFMRRVAELLQEPFEQLALHFRAQEVVLPTRQNFKADDKPVAGGKQTFEEALQTAGLNEEQQAYLRSL